MVLTQFYWCVWFLFGTRSLLPCGPAKVRASCLGYNLLSPDSAVRDGVRIAIPLTQDIGTTLLVIQPWHQPAFFAYNPNETGEGRMRRNLVTITASTTQTSPGCWGWEDVRTT